MHDFTERDDGKLNYSIIQPAAWRVSRQSIAGVPEKAVQAIPVPVRYGGTIPDDAYFGEDKEEGGMKAFNIRTTSAKEATEAFNQANKANQG